MDPRSHSPDLTDFSSLEGLKRKGSELLNHSSKKRRPKKHYDPPRPSKRHDYAVSTTEEAEQIPLRIQHQLSLVQNSSVVEQRKMISQKVDQQVMIRCTIDVNELFELPKEIYNPRGSISSLDAQSFLDNDSSSNSSSICSWSNNTTISSKSCSPDHDIYECPSPENVQEDVDADAFPKDYAFERSSSQPTPQIFLLTHQTAKEGGMILKIAEHELTLGERHESFQSEAISNTPDRLPSQIPSPGGESPQAPSSSSDVDEDDDPSMGGGNSSQSQTSSKVSDAATQGTQVTPSDTDPNTLKGFLNSVLRTEPLVAKELYHSLNGKLEFAPNSPDVDLDTSSPLSMLNLLSIQDPRPVQHLGALTYTPSSSSGSSTSSYSSSSANNRVETKGSSSTSGFSGGNALSSSNTSSGKDATNNGSVGQSIKQHKGKAKSNTSTSSKIQSLRCFHNVTFPETFRVNHDTRDRFRACSGPGWNTFQHLKDHAMSHHTKKPDSLKCKSCQKDFDNQESYDDHDATADCEIRCPSCDETFQTKAMRTTHQNEEHPGVGKTSVFRELDDATWKRLKENLKAFTESLRKGKGPQDPNLQRWVEKNTTRYMKGRPTNSNPMLELGQWYIMFHTLSLQEIIPEHPFYDYLSAADLAEETIRLIFRHTVKAKIKVNGPPPSDLQAQMAWYEDILGQSLQISAKTKLKMDGKPLVSDNTDEYSAVTPYAPELNPSYTQQASLQQAAYNQVPVPVPPCEIPGEYEMMMRSNASAIQPQLAMMHPQLSGMGPPPQNFYLESPQQMGMPRLSSIETSSSNNIVGGDWNESQMTNLEYSYGEYGLDSNMMEDPRWMSKRS